MANLRSLASQTAVYGVSNVVGRLLNFLLVPLYVRLFASEDYGVVTELYSYVAFLNVLYTYGTESSFFRFIEEKPDKNEVYTTQLISLFASSLLFSGVLWLGAQPLADLMRYPNHAEYIRMFALVLAFDAIASIPFSMLRYKQRGWMFAILKLINIGLNVGLNVFILVYLPKHPEFPFAGTLYDPSVGVGYIFAINVFANAATLLMLLPAIPWRSMKFNFGLWKEMMSYSWPLLFVGMAFVINETLDRMMLKYFIVADNPERELGIYGAVYKLAMLMTLFTQSFRMGAEPFFHAMYRRTGDLKIFGLTLKYFTLLGLLFFLVVCLFRNEIGLQFFGKRHPEYLEGLFVVPILFFANLMLGIYYNISVWYRLADQTKMGARLSIFGASVTILGNFITIPLLGYAGAAWTTLACYFSMVIVCYVIGKKRFPIPYPVLRLILWIAAGLAVYFIGEISISSSHWMDLAFKGALFAGFAGSIALIEKPWIDFKNH